LPCGKLCPIHLRGEKAKNLEFVKFPNFYMLKTYMDSFKMLFDRKKTYMKNTKADEPPD
jgi:hypothetical protein